jgi:hypothetical protein
MSDLEILRKRKAGRKQKIAVWNRRLAWITLPMLLISTFSVYSAQWNWFPALLTFGIITSLIFIIVLFAHSGFSVYLFGFPKFKWQIRILHIYIGYGIFVFTMISQSIIGFEPYHNIAYAINWLFIIGHVALSTRFMLKRNVKKKPETELEFYTGGNIFRDLK